MAGKSIRIGLICLIIQVFCGVLKRGARFEMLELHHGEMKSSKAGLDCVKKVRSERSQWCVFRELAVVFKLLWILSALAFFLTGLHVYTYGSHWHFTVAHAQHCVFFVVHLTHGLDAQHLAIPAGWLQQTLKDILVPGFCPSTVAGLDGISNRMILQWQQVAEMERV